MLFFVVAAVTLAACQGAFASSSGDHFAKYFRSEGSLEDLTFQDHAEFAFRGPSSRRPLPTEVDALEAPTVYNNGFVYVNFYDKTSCSGNIVAVTGRPTNVCLKAYENVTSSEPTGSYRYTCNSGTSYVQQFSDTNCQVSFPTFQENLICENAIGRYSSMRGFCNEDPSVLPLPNTNFVSQLQYDDPSTCSADLEQFESFATGVCFKIDSTHSIKYDSTKSYEYPSNDCSGTAVVKTLPTSCVPITTYPVEATSNVASKWVAGAVNTGLYNGPGYVWANFYQGKNCAGVIAGQEGFPTGVCLLVYGNASSSDATGSKKYSCNSATEFYQEYSDLTCTTPVSNYTQPMTCKNIIGRFGSALGQCNSDNSQLPLPLGQMVVETLYNTANTCGTISQFNVFANDVCFHSGNKGFAYQWPNVTFYDDASCSTTITSESALPQTCKAVSQFPANTPVASKWSYSNIPFPPTPSPTTPPTPMPTPVSYSKGFLYVNLYEQKSCQGPIVAVTGRPTETCLVTYDDATSSTPTGSAMFTCSGGMSNSLVFSDTNCKVPMGNTTNDLLCHNVLGRAGSVQGVCSSDSSRLPLPANNFTTQIQYDSPTSCGGNIVQFESFESKHCFSNGGGSSFQFIFPMQYFYPVGQGCNGRSSGNTTLSQNCVPVPSYPIPDGSPHVAYKWVYGGQDFGGSGNNDLTTAEIAGISAGGAVAAVGIAAAAYYFVGQGAASGAATAVGGGAANPMVSAV